MSLFMGKILASSSSLSFQQRHLLRRSPEIENLHEIWTQTHQPGESRLLYPLQRSPEIENLHEIWTQTHPPASDVIQSQQQQVLNP